MNEQARVSVIIPTFNRRHRVPGAISSVLDQSPAAIPVVIDDCSTDGTVEMLQEAFDRQIRLIRQPENQEKSAARNAGIAAAETEFLCFLDSDDTMEPGAVQALLKVYDEDPEFYGAAYGGCYIGDRPEIPLDALPQGDVLHEYVRKPFLHTLSFMIRRSTLQEIGAYREDLTNLEDIELFIRLMARLEFRPCNAFVARIHKQDDSASINYDKIARQGTKILDYLRDDPVVMQQLGDDFALVQKKIYHELARALYKSRCYREYCRIYDEMRRALPNEFKAGAYKRRYLLSRLLQPFSR